MIKSKILDYLKSLKIEVEKIEVPKKEEFGDFSIPLYQLAKKEGKNLEEYKKYLEKKMREKRLDILANWQFSNGYLNFFINWEKVLKEAFNLIKRKSLENKKKKVMVEFSAPNPAHPMHIGHARSTFLGYAISKILEFNGYKVIKANYYNDLGLQVAKLVSAYLLWGKNKKPKGKEDLWLWNFYIKFHEEEKKNSDLTQYAKNILKKFEIEKDKTILKTWKRIVNLCIKGIEKTYKDLKISFDEKFYESNFRDMGKKLVEESLKKKISYLKDGAVIANLEKFNLPNIVLLRSDGTGLYITSDLGLTKYKFEKYKLDKSIWVVSSQQDIYFKQLFKILELLKVADLKRLYHFSFHHIFGEEGKMSSREGKAILMDEVLRKLVFMSKKEIERRKPKIKKKEINKLAKMIAISAFKYFILKVEEKDPIKFEWEKILKFSGNTSLYLQYTYVRCKRILEKSKFRYINFKIDNLDKDEKSLARKIFEFFEVVKKCGEEIKVHNLCNYLYDLSKKFNEFYEKCKVIGSERFKVRILLVFLTQKILKKGLELLGVEALPYL